MCIDLLSEKPPQAVKKKEKRYEQNTIGTLKCPILSIYTSSCSRKVKRMLC